MVLMYLAFFLSALGVYAASPTQTVDLGYAKYAGIFDETTGNSRFLGMRYAAPPTSKVDLNTWISTRMLIPFEGHLRWQAPKSPAVTVGVQKADVQPPMCMTGGVGNSPTSPFRTTHPEKHAIAIKSEDCLFLKCV